MRNVKYFLTVTLFSLLSFIAGCLFSRLFADNLSVLRVKNTVPIKKERPLGKYTIENLSLAQIPASEIIVESLPGNKDQYSSGLYSMVFSPTADGKNTKKVTGLINIPKSTTGSPEKKYPLVLMLRGYVDQKLYQTGMGTKRAGEYFAENGFITVAPDFFGYGRSDTEAANIFESRFQTYVTALATLNSLKSIEAWNEKDIFIWGHSNGGQIALILLEITGKEYPTTLWAPVSKPFPYSVIYYTDESEDKGKLIRKELAKFEDDYDVEKYSLDNYLNRIKAPVQIHQGTNDDAVPLDWSKSLNSKLKSLDIDSTLYTYPGADHNLQPAWNEVVERDLEFFIKKLQN